MIRATLVSHVWRGLHRRCAVMGIFSLLLLVTISFGQEDDPTTPVSGSRISKDVETLLLYRAALDQYKAGEYTSSLEWLERATKILPPSLKNALWTLKASDIPFQDVLLAENSIYVISTDLKQHAAWNSLGAEVPQVLNTGRYDWKYHFISCYDPQTGALRWRRKTIGAFRVFVDEIGRKLYISRNRTLIALASANGEVVEEIAINSEYKHAVNSITAILVNDRLLLEASASATDQLMVYDVAKETLSEKSSTHFTQLPVHATLNELTYSLQQNPGDVTSSIHLQSRGDERQKTLWVHKNRGNSYNRPFWHAGDALFMHGTTHTAGKVVRLNGDSGEPIWRYRMQTGASRPLGGWITPRPTNNALWLMGNRLLAYDTQHTLHVLDPKSGTLKQRIHLNQPLLRQPKEYGNVLLLPLASRISAVPRQIFFEQPEPSESTIALLRSRNLFALGRHDEALDEVRRVLEQTPWRHEAYLLAGQLLHVTGRQKESVKAYIQYMEMTGENHPTLDVDDQGKPLPAGTTRQPLFEQYGLLRRIKVGGQITASLMAINNTVLAMGSGGNVATIHAPTLETLMQELPASPQKTISPPRHQVILKVQYSDRRSEDLVVELPSSPASHTTFTSSPDSPPRAWHTVSGRDGRVVKYHNRYYRPLGGGGVRVLLEDNSMETHESIVPGITSWNIFLHNTTPIGYGSGGVYLLDHNLRPKKYLLKFHHVIAIAGDDTSLAVVANDGKRSFVATIYDAETLDIINSIAINNGWGLRDHNHLIQPAMGGYIIAADELIWMPAEPEQNPRRLFLNHHLHDNGDQKRQNLTSFTVSPERLFVGSRDGAVYVFDLKAFCQPPNE